MTSVPELTVGNLWTTPKTASGAPATLLYSETGAMYETRAAAGMVFYTGTNGLRWVPATGGTSTFIAIGDMIDVDANYLYWLDMSSPTPTAWRLAFTDIAANRLTPTRLATFASRPSAIAYLPDRAFTVSDRRGWTGVRTQLFGGVRSIVMNLYDGSPPTTLATQPIGLTEPYSDIAVTPTAVFFFNDGAIWKLAR